MTIRQATLMALLCLLLFTSQAGTGLAAEPPQPVVRAVMFWMDGCPHCHEVLDNVLPPLQAQYGEQLDVHLVEVVTAEELDQLYQIGAAVGVPRDYVGVPFLLIGDRALVGSQQIPAELPNLVKWHLANGGIDYPDVPQLAPFLPQEAIATPLEGAAPVSALAVESGTVAPVSDGFALAVAVLVGMFLVLLYAGLRLFGARRGWRIFSHPAWLQQAIPLLAIAGLAVAAYLAYVETQAVTAVCGPIGDCNAVQTSEYAYLFGIPIGVLGVVGYLAILVAWGWSRWQGDPRAPLAVLGMTAVGVLFSVYLTYLEPFVIGAVCAWCLTSAVIMALLLLASVEPAARELVPVRSRGRRRHRGYR